MDGSTDGFMDGSMEGSKTGMDPWMDTWVSFILLSYKQVPYRKKANAAKVDDSNSCPS